MPLYTKDSLERLRGRIELIEALSPHLELKRTGAAYKARCPFHEEKTPSFTIQKGDTHYHCYGCGAHGDAIQFLMNYLKLGFGQAVETLAEQFQVPLEIVDNGEEKGPNKVLLKEALETASHLFQACLFYSAEGHVALQYLIKRGLTIDFLKRFEVGFAPQKTGWLRKILNEKKFNDELLIEAGLLGEKKLEFFRERITFPIKNPAGQTIGFSARKYKEETFGGKYINTPETPLFKKSRLLFGMNYCRRRIASERNVIIVEGQIDCLKMIESGFNLTVAALGTAFGEGHIRELEQLGVRRAFLLFDPDKAGQAAASKVGNLFQKAGVEVTVITLPDGMDPDAFLCRFGAEKLIERLQSGADYLTFQVKHLSLELKADSPAGKAELIKTVKEQINNWDHPVMVHESLRKVAALTHVPEEIMGVGQEYSSLPYIRRTASLPFSEIDPSRVLELDLLRWLILMGTEKTYFMMAAEKYLTESHFWTPMCRSLYQAYSKAAKEGTPTDLLALFISIHEEEAQKYIDEILQKKINRERADDHFRETIQKLVDRQWMHQREEIKREIHSGKYNEDAVLQLAKQFDELKKQRTIVELHA